jgi:N-formylglutamate amidohydrolase
VTLPLLLSVPHAGLEVPGWLRENCRLTTAEIVADGDEGAAEVYALGEHVVRFVTTRVARAVLDMNRAEDDRRTDGVVKTHTCWNVPIWREALDEMSVERLLAEHHRPYHAALARGAAEAGVHLGVDAHTMAALGPPVGPDPGAERPLACVSNADGTCPDDWIRTLADALSDELGGEVRVNDPFRGGHITRTHAVEMPWLQLELSRADFLTSDEKCTAILQALERLARRIRD